MSVVSSLIIGLTHLQAAIRTLTLTNLTPIPTPNTHPSTKPLYPHPDPHP